jgi:hypothetical protein
LGYCERSMSNVNKIVQCEIERFYNKLIENEIVIVNIVPFSELLRK